MDGNPNSLNFALSLFLSRYYEGDNSSRGRETRIESEDPEVESDSPATRRIERGIICSSTDDTDGNRASQCQTLKGEWDKGGR